jgi:8-oxo-dGTP pyrophosphatase MutT (NUDIX family)
MTDRTLCFLTRGDPPDEVLLGLKKAGFGAGKYAGFGGGMEAGESIQAAAVRELAEETGIRLAESDLIKVGQLRFIFPYRPDWSQVVHVFRVKSWTGEPVESSEMRPAWFKISEVPYTSMWSDAPHWLPLILSGKRVSGRLVLKSDQ